MADLTGSALVLQWIHSGGTATLNTDYRTFSSTPAVGLVDASAGADTYKTYLTALKDNKYSYKALYQAGGTVIKAALAAGNYGTLIIAPEGTASGKPKETIPAISMGANMQYPYDNVIEISCDFQGNGAPVLSTY